MGVSVRSGLRVCGLRRKARPAARRPRSRDAKLSVAEVSCDVFLATSKKRRSGVALPARGVRSVRFLSRRCLATCICDVEKATFGSASGSRGCLAASGRCDLWLRWTTLRDGQNPDW